jgi:DNA-binding transcriptional regulator YdaS (Cro superfamily)
MTSKNEQKIKNYPLYRAVKQHRFQSALAYAIGVKQQNIWHWLYKTGVVPAEHVLKIEQATKDKGHKITRHELRPDIYPQNDVS